MKPSRGVQWLVIGTVLAAGAQNHIQYPHELPQYRFFATAKWNALTSGVATMADVRKVLGDPDEANDISHYSDPYPGDLKAKSPVFTYKKLMSGWQVLVYFSRTCSHTHPDDPIGDHVCSFDLIPNRPISFKNVVFPPEFVKTYDPGVETPFFRFRDANGLEYETYVTIASNGDRVPGNLDRISYGRPSTHPSSNSSK